MVGYTSMAKCKALTLSAVKGLMSPFLFQTVFSQSLSLRLAKR